MKTTASMMGLTMVLFALGGCLQHQPAPSKTFYMLSIESNPSPLNAPLASCLRVRPVTVHPSFAGASLIYRTGDLTYEKDYYNQFMVAPDLQFASLLNDWLRTAGVSLCIDTLESDRKRMILEPHLEALFVDFRKSEAPAAYAGFRFVLTRYDPSCRCSAIAMDQRLEAVVPLPPKPSAQDVVEAMGHAIQEVLDNLHPALQKSFIQ